MCKCTYFQYQFSEHARSRVFSTKERDIAKGTLLPLRVANSALSSQKKIGTNMAENTVKQLFRSFRIHPMLLNIQELGHLGMPLVLILDHI